MDDDRRRADKAARAKRLAERTNEVMNRCNEAMSYLEMNPATNPYYAALMKEARDAYGKAAQAWLKCWEDPFEANPPIALARMRLNHLREQLDAMLAAERAKAEEEERRHAESERMADERQKATMDAIEELRGRLPKRADFGGKHATSGGADGPRPWRSADDVAADFNKAAFKPMHGKRMVGTCTAGNVRKWDKKYPDYDHRNKKWGYYAKLHCDGNLKKKYWEVLAAWLAYFKAYAEWDKRHPGARFRPKKQTDIDPARMGVDGQGGLIVEARPDPRRG